MTTDLNRSTRSGAGSYRLVARTSLAGLIWAVVLSALLLACLMFASSPWTSVVLSTALAGLAIAPLGMIYRRGERRAWWIGFGLCGWTYVLLTFNLMFFGELGVGLVTSKLLYWAYQRLIPASRQQTHPRNELREFRVTGAVREGGLTWEDTNGSLVDVWITGRAEMAPSVLLKGVPTSHGYGMTSAPATGPTLMVNADQYARLVDARSHARQIVLRPHAPSLVDPNWSSPTVGWDEFEKVGHAWFALFFAWVGGRAGRFFYMTRPELERP